MLTRYSSKLVLRSFRAYLGNRQVPDLGLDSKTGGITRSTPQEPKSWWIEDMLVE